MRQSRWPAEIRGLQPVEGIYNICTLRGLQPVEGIVLDVGWYRTTIRSFEREIYAIPNSVFSRNVVLNVTRKGREWRIFEFIGAPPTRPRRPRT